MGFLQTVYGKKDIQKRFNISLATVNNWIKTGLIPSPTNGCYTKETYIDLVRAVEIDSEKLKSRANRSFSTVSDIVFLGIKERSRKELLVKLFDVFKSSSLSVSDAVVCLGKQILISNGLYDKRSDIFKQLNELYDGENIFQNFYIKNKDDDILGAFFQSVQNVARKSQNGSFFTPPEILTSIKIPLNAKVLDPCCGSGGILIRTLSKKHDPSRIYAFDIDEIALIICRINLILFFGDAFISPNVENHDIIFSKTENETYDFIITNPPWGSKLSKEQKDFLLRAYPVLGTTEVFSVALYNSIDKLTEQGQLNFFLPESILNVSAHKNIRKILLGSNRDMEIFPLGAVFKGVQSECVLLKLSEEKREGIKIVVRGEKTIALDTHSVIAPDYLISYSLSDKDSKILNKLYSADSVKLFDSTKFALGIVTGNNKKHLHESKNDGDEAIFRGKEIMPYTLKSPEYFIRFLPEIFQQVAPVEIYRSKKIVYKFISDKIVCALDNGNLFLNSANIIISDEYPMEILVALYNSPIYSFIYKKKFKSKKLLKRHFQDFPLPVLSKNLESVFFALYESVIKGTKSQYDIDKVICKYFKITESEYLYIRECVYGNA